MHEFHLTVPYISLTASSVSPVHEILTSRSHSAVERFCERPPSKFLINLTSKVLQVSRRNTGRLSFVHLPRTDRGDVHLPVGREIAALGCAQLYFIQSRKLGTTKKLLYIKMHFLHHNATKRNVDRRAFKTGHPNLYVKNYSSVFLKAFDIISVVKANVSFVSVILLKLQNA